MGCGLSRYYEYLLSDKEQTLDFEMEQVGLGPKTSGQQPTLSPRGWLLRMVNPQCSRSRQ